jgi:putative PIN family toxin of toxin-antitoxin system
MSIERLVVDSNVLISAALSVQGTPARLLDVLVESRSILLFSEPTMAELASRLMGSNFDAYVDRSMRICFLAELDAVTEFVGITGAPMGCRDRDDDKFLETALSGAADLVVTGDSDLLVLNPWQEIPILRPGQAIERLVKR